MSSVPALPLGMDLGIFENRVDPTFLYPVETSRTIQTRMFFVSINAIPHGIPIHPRSVQQKSSWNPLKYRCLRLCAAIPAVDFGSKHI